MSIIQIETLSIAILVAITCSLPGTFLVLRQMSMMADAISHTILLGIILGFFIVHDVNHPLLIIGAALIGVVTVFITELLNKIDLIKEDASIGLTFPFLFSIAIVLISYYARNAHIGVHAVLLGEIVFAPFNRLMINGIDFGPKALYIMGTILIINLVYIIVFYKELKIVTFDKGLAAVLGISPVIIHYSFMSIVSITCVGAFDTVGSILVIALIIGPPATAYLLTNNLKVMIGLSALFGSISATVGYAIALWLDSSIAGCIAAVIGFVFIVTFILAPKKGLLSTQLQRHSKKLEFSRLALLIHIINHGDSKEEKEECSLNSIHNHLHWNKSFLERIIDSAKRDNYIFVDKDILKITEKGKSYAVNYHQNILDRISVDN
ncbi:MAG: metal ABC transporter permease [Clostridia bacterium]|nr:metal ABC transporter permease [Clostridia bacterium]